MPSDITGTEIWRKTRPPAADDRFVKGPIFANIVLADEINRTPPKTQAALLQAMQEYRVTVGRRDSIPGQAVFGAGHAKPDRAGRDLSAARGPAGPLHVQDHGGLSEFRRGVGHRRANHVDDPPNSSRSWTGRAILTLQRIVRKVIVGRTRGGLRREAGPRDPAGLEEPRLRQQVSDLGARARGPASACCWAGRQMPC